MVEDTEDLRKEIVLGEISDSINRRVNIRTIGTPESEEKVNIDHM